MRRTASRASRNGLMAAHTTAPLCRRLAQLDKPASLSLIGRFAQRDHLHAGLLEVVVDQDFVRANPAEVINVARPHQASRGLDEHARIHSRGRALDELLLRALDQAAREVGHDVWPAHVLQLRAHQRRPAPKADEVAGREQVDHAQRTGYARVAATAHLAQHARVIGRAHEAIQWREGADRKHLQIAQRARRELDRAQTVSVRDQNRANRGGRPQVDLPLAGRNRRSLRSACAAPRLFGVDHS